MLIFTHFLKISSIQFDFNFEKLVRVQFASTSLLKNRFGFGSVRLNFQKVGSSSVRIDSNRTVLVRFGSVRFRASDTKRYSGLWAFLLYNGWPIKNYPLSIFKIYSLSQARLS
jgi:hypothetical protein